jgi:hypothetical protein
VWPIAVEEVWVRVTSLCALAACQDAGAALAHLQRKVSTPGGSQSVGLALRLGLSSCPWDVTFAGSCHVRRTFASRGYSRGKASNWNRKTALLCSEGANSAQTCPPETRFKSCHALGLFFVCVSSIDSCGEDQVNTAVKKNRHRLPRCHFLAPGINWQQWQYTGWKLPCEENLSFCMPLSGEGLEFESPDRAFVL